MNINNSIYVKGVLKASEKPQPDYPEVVILGRSNVGKSSLINTVLQRKNLARTSSTPGKTRLINYFLIDNQFYLVDLPGYGYVSKKDADSRLWDQRLGHFLTSNRRIKLALILIDSRHPGLEADRYSIEWLIQQQIPLVIILTKCDKLSANKFQHVRAQIQDAYPGVTIIPFSAKDQTGRNEILELLEKSTGKN